MSFNSFRKEFIGPEPASKSPSRAHDAIELIPESALVRNIAELLKTTPSDSSRGGRHHKHKARSSQTHRNGGRAVQSGSRQALPRATRHSHNGSASFQIPPPASPIDTLASVAAIQANSPIFHSPSTFYTSNHAASHIQVSPLTTTYPAPHWGTGQWDDYNQHAEERPTKRARSEMLPSPQQTSPRLDNGANRPATSYNSGWGYNLEQSIDQGERMYSPAFSSHAFEPKNPREDRMSGAELLLNFSRGGSWSSMNEIHIKTTNQDKRAAPTPRAISPPSLPPFPFVDSRPTRIIASGLSASRVSDEDSTLPVNPTLPQQPESEDNTNGPSLKVSVQSVQTYTPPEDSALTSDHPGIHETSSLLEDGALNAHQRSLDNAENLESSSNEKPGIDVAISTSTNDEGAQASHNQLQSPQSLPAEATELQSPPLSVQLLPTLFPAVPSHPDMSSHLDQPQDAEPNISNKVYAESPRLPSHSPSPHAENPTLSGQDYEAIPAEVGGEPSSSSSLHEQGVVCPICRYSAGFLSDKVDWLQCDGCDQWCHSSCAGYTAKESRRIDKYYCQACRPKFGSTTWKRKSARVHTTVDYAGLNEGVLRTSDDTPEHHYIEPIKNGRIKLMPEKFPRMAPEEITSEFFEKVRNFSEPIVIPAALNPPPSFLGKSAITAKPSPVVADPTDLTAQKDSTTEEDLELVVDDGQDKLDMVIPQGLTVRRVAELYGPKNEIPVIDVKAQEGERKKWTVERWADYYEATGEKVIRNVISLECSNTPLGRLIRRPKVVRDLDLQDSVWPKNETRKMVGFYVLMSVADCFTDFHIDFGGSSVYYHILKGKKTFFFIPPTQSNLQKYQEWNMMPSQNYTWLPEQTKTEECYRVDLSEGDTMLIPSGWIHAVWTPEDSLVIGGNFLTRLHYSMQFRVAEIERINKTNPKFKYPRFQKVMWYTILQYLEEDPLPDSVRDLFLDGKQFDRAWPVWIEFNKFGHNSDLGPENYNARYYPKAELEGWPDMVNYIFRTVMIYMDRLEGVTKETRKSVSDSIPKGRGEPLEIAKKFAMWAAWKRGGEDIPEWAHPGAVLPSRPDETEKKLSDAQFKKLQRAAAIPTPERQSARLRNANGVQQSELGTPTSTPKTSTLGPRRTACDACRKRKMRCKHLEPAATANGVPAVKASTPSSAPPQTTLLNAAATSPTAPIPVVLLLPQTEIQAPPQNPIESTVLANGTKQQPETPDGKKGRNKACQECRRSKRRCIHDENGNVDPVKQNEPIVPRGSAKRKLAPDSDTSSAKKLKTEPESLDHSTQATNAESSTHEAVAHGISLINGVWLNGASNASELPGMVMHDASIVTQDHPTSSGVPYEPAQLQEAHSPQATPVSYELHSRDDGYSKYIASHEPGDYADTIEEQSHQLSHNMEEVETMDNFVDMPLDPALFANESNKPVDSEMINGVESQSARVRTPSPIASRLVNGNIQDTSPETSRGKPRRSKTPAKTPVRQKSIKPETKEAPGSSTPTADMDEDTRKLIEHIRQNDLGLRRRSRGSKDIP